MVMFIRVEKFGENRVDVVGSGSNDEAFERSVTIELALKRFLRRTSFVVVVR